MFVATDGNISIEDCAFYHRVDIPGTEQKDWQWDLRGSESKYLGDVDFHGRRVLEFGPANGGLTFWMARNGADVVGADLGPDSRKFSWDVLWHPGLDVEKTYDVMSRTMRAFNNGWLYGRRYFGANSKLLLSTAYDTPMEAGPFDIVVWGSILLHLRDPIGALQNGLKFRPQTVIITDRTPAQLASRDELKRPLSYFQPNAKSVSPHGGLTWWHVNPQVYIQFLDAMGYQVKALTYNLFNYRNVRPTELFTLVAERRA